MEKKRTDLFFCGVLCVLVLFMAPPTAFLPSHLLASKYSDVLTQYLPHQHVIRHSILEDRTIPLWNPFECAGNPVFPNPLYPLFTFPHAILFLFPPSIALNLGFILHLLIAAVGMYAYMRKIGTKGYSALFAGLIYSLGTRSLVHIHAGFYSRFMLFSWIPLLFLGCEYAFSKPGRRSAILIAASSTLAFLTGALQLLVYTFLFLTLYIVFRYATLRTKTSHFSPGAVAVTLFAGATMAILLSAFSLLPALRLFPFLTRARIPEISPLSLMPSIRSIPALFNPRLLTDFSPGTVLQWESALYPGIAPLLLIIHGLSQPRRVCAFWPWILLTFISLLFTFRECAFLQWPLMKLTPFLSSFRNPGRGGCLFAFFSAALSGLLLHLHIEKETDNRGNSPRSYLLSTALTLTVLAVLMAVVPSREELIENFRTRFISFFGARQMQYLDMKSVAVNAENARHGLFHSIALQSLALLTAGGLLSSRCYLRKRGYSFAVPALIGITFIDLCYFGKAYLRTHSLDELYPRTPLSSTLKEQARTGRLVDISPPASAAFWTNLPFRESVRLGISRIDGYTPIILSPYARYIDILTGVKSPEPRCSITIPRITFPEMLSLLRAELLISTNAVTHPALELVARFDDIPRFKQFLGSHTIPRLFLYRNRDCLPRAWLASSAFPCPPEKEKELLPYIDPRTHLLIPPRSRGITDGESYRPVAIRSRGPNRLECDITLSRPAWLVLSESWAPGWTAYDNGNRVEVTRVNTALRGIALDAGRHSLTILYRPPGLWWGALISLLTLTGIVCVSAHLRMGAFACRRAGV